MRQAIFDRTITGNRVKSMALENLKGLVKGGVTLETVVEKLLGKIQTAGVFSKYNSEQVKTLLTDLATNLPEGSGVLRDVNKFLNTTASNRLDTTTVGMETNQIYVRSTEARDHERELYAPGNTTGTNFPEPDFMATKFTLIQRDASGNESTSKGDYEIPSKHSHNAPVTELKDGEFSFNRQVGSNDPIYAVAKGEVQEGWNFTMKVGTSILTMPLNYKGEQGIESTVSLMNGEVSPTELQKGLREAQQGIGIIHNTQDKPIAWAKIIDGKLHFTEIKDYDDKSPIGKDSIYQSPKSILLNQGFAIGYNSTNRALEVVEGGKKTVFTKIGGEYKTEMNHSLRRALPMTPPTESTTDVIYETPSAGHRLEIVVNQSSLT